jgi:hypothetical protein
VELNKTRNVSCCWLFYTAPLPRTYRDVQRQLEQFRLELELFFASALGFTSEGASQEAAE